MTAIRPATMDVVASASAAQELLDLASTSIDELASTAGDAMRGTWFQQRLHVRGYVDGANEGWHASIGQPLQADPRVGAGIHDAARGIDLLLEESHRFAGLAGDVRLQSLIGSTRDRVRAGTAPILAVDRIPGRTVARHELVPMQRGPVELQTQLHLGYQYKWAAGTTIDETMVRESLATAALDSRHAARIATELPERALLRLEADEAVAGVRHAFQSSRALGAKQLTSTDLAALATGVEQLAAHAASVGQRIRTEGVVHIDTATRAAPVLVDRVGLDGHASAVEHSMDQLLDLVETARGSAPTHVSSSLDSLTRTAEQTRSNARSLRTLALELEDGADSQVSSLQRRGVDQWDDEEDVVSALWTTHRERVTGRVFSRTVERPVAREQFSYAPTAFAPIVAELRELAGDAATGSLRELDGATTLARATEAIAAARARHAAALAPPTPR